MYSFSKDNKRCATCEFLCGLRSIVRGGVEASENRGKCQMGVYSSDPRGPSTIEGCGCKKFKRWSKL